MSVLQAPPLGAGAGASAHYAFSTPSQPSYGRLPQPSTRPFVLVPDPQAFQHYRPTEGGESPRSRPVSRPSHQSPALDMCRPTAVDARPRQLANGLYVCTAPSDPSSDPSCATLTFARKCEWRKHMDRHERPYHCAEPSCAKLQAFTYRGGLLRHEREVHGKHGGPRERLACPVEECKRHSDRGFSRRENLIEHLRRVHKRGLTPLAPTAPPAILAPAGNFVTGAWGGDVKADNKETLLRSVEGRGAVVAADMPPPYDDDNTDDEDDSESDHDGKSDRHSRKRRRRAERAERREDRREERHERREERRETRAERRDDRRGGARAGPAAAATAASTADPRGGAVAWDAVDGGGEDLTAAVRRLWAETRQQAAQIRELQEQLSEAKASLGAQFRSA